MLSVYFSLFYNIHIKETEVCEYNMITCEKVHIYKALY